MKCAWRTRPTTMPARRRIHKRRRRIVRRAGGPHMPMVYKFVYRYVGNADAANDVVQDVFIKVWKNIKKFDPDKRISRRGCSRSQRIPRSMPSKRRRRSCFQRSKKGRPTLMRSSRRTSESADLPDELLRKKTDQSRPRSRIAGTESRLSERASTPLCRTSEIPGDRGHAPGAYRYHQKQAPPGAHPAEEDACVAPKGTSDSYSESNHTHSMNANYEKLFSTLPDPEPPAGLTEKILLRISRRERNILGAKIAASACVFGVSVGRRDGGIYQPDGEPFAIGIFPDLLAHVLRFLLDGGQLPGLCVLCHGIVPDIYHGVAFGRGVIRDLVHGGAHRRGIAFPRQESVAAQFFTTHEQFFRIKDSAGRCSGYWED